MVISEFAPHLKKKQRSKWFIVMQKYSANISVSARIETEPIKSISLSTPKLKNKKGIIRRNWLMWFLEAG